MNSIQNFADSDGLSQFERWLIDEAVVYKITVDRLDEKRKTGDSVNPLSHGIFIGQFSTFISILSRYTDRHPDSLRDAAISVESLTREIREGESFKSYLERVTPL